VNDVTPILKGGQRQLQPVCDILQETHDPFALQNPSDRGGMGGGYVAAGKDSLKAAGAARSGRHQFIAIRRWIATMPPIFSLSWINLPR
jgi:hypothetical protein